MADKLRKAAKRDELETKIDIEQLIEKIIRKELERFKKEIKIMIDEEIVKKIDSISKKMVELEKEVNTINTKWFALEEDVETMKMRNPSTEIHEIRLELEKAMKISRDSMVTANDMDQALRINNVRILGLEVREDDNLMEVVSTFIRDKLKVPDVTNNDIKSVYQIPFRRNDENRQDSGMSSRRSVIMVQFKELQDRNIVIRSRKILKSSQVSIAEDLTSLNVQLLQRLHKNETIKDSWSWNGKIYAKLEGGRKLLVKPYQAVEELGKLSKD